MSAAAVELLLLIVALYGLELLARPAPPRVLLTGVRSLAPRAPGLTARTPWPFGLSFVLEGFRLWPGSDAVVIVQPHHLTTRQRAGAGERVVRYADLRAVAADGEHVLVNGAVVLETGSAREARSVCAWLQALARGERDLARFVAARLDLTTARASLQRVREETRLLRGLATALWIALFSAVPVFFATPLGERAPLVVPGVLVTLLVAVLFEYRRVHRAWYPLDRSERRWRLARMLLAFPMACRAVDALVHDAFHEHHALAVLRVAAPAEFAEAARRALLELPYGLATSPAAAAVEAELRPHVLAALRALVVDAGLDPDALTAPPARRSADAAGYCPRCHEEFTAGTATCADCAVALLPL